MTRRNLIKITTPMNARNTLIGSRWKAIVNGKKSLNGKPYSATFSGDIFAEDGDEDIYDAMEALVESLRDQNAEMELPHGIQITIQLPASEA